MREPQTECEVRAIEKFEGIVKKVIDEYDPIGVMDRAPDNHYDIEIRDIALRVSIAHSVEDVQKIIYVIMSYWFGVDEGGTFEKCKGPAQRIADRIGLKK